MNDIAGCLHPASRLHPARVATPMCSPASPTCRTTRSSPRPSFAKRMLDTLAEAWAASHDGANLWADSTVTFLDPCTKSGVFLREITSRLTAIGLAQEIPDLQDARQSHPDPSRCLVSASRSSPACWRGAVCIAPNTPMARIPLPRSFDSDAGNIWFERTEHTWVEKSGANSNARFVVPARKRIGRVAMTLETHAYAFIHTRQHQDSDDRVVWRRHAVRRHYWATHRIS
jgi:site-specific DNA-methyltransferase (adenine-specific)